MTLSCEGGVKMFVDYAFINGKVYTLEGSMAEAVAVSGEKISALGKTIDIKGLCDSNTKIIDLEGKCLLPGFNDSHMHFIGHGLLYDKIHLRGVASVDEMVNLGRKFIEERNRKDGEWVVGYGFDQNLFIDKTFPLKEDIDKISDKHPVLVDRVCGHIGTVNTLALKILGITKNTVIQGGIIDKDEYGNPTGILREAALDWAKSHIPRPNVEQIKDIIMQTAEEALSLGLTSLQTNDSEAADFDTVFEAYQSLRNEDKLKIRIFEEIHTSRPEELKLFLGKGMKTGFGDDFFQIGNIKLFADGSLGARTAAMREAYSDDPNTRGIFVYTQEELDELVDIAHKAGMQVACHAIGDGAIEQCINAIEKAMKKNSKDLRHRIIHCQIVDAHLLKRMVCIGIGADIQPPFVASDYMIVADRVGVERGNKSYPWKTMLDLGIHLGGGSDCPVETYDPLWGIYCAVTRQDEKGQPAGGWLPDERLSVEEAVKLYTIGSAYLSFEENKKGTIKEGKLADMVVLSEDVFEVKPENIKDIQVLLTMVGGKIQYTKMTQYKDLVYTGRMQI